MKEFVDYINECPADLNRRLIFSDWLEEQGKYLSAEWLRQCVTAQQSGVAITATPDYSLPLSHVYVCGIGLNWIPHPKNPFFMGIFPVTQAQWEAVMKMNPSHFRGPNRPVENVSWHDCDKFCAELKRLTGMAIRLPTEAEWEYACRAGTTTEYYSGNSESDLARVGWYDENSGGRTHDVGEKGEASKNKWGLFDMHGNVWEWTSSRYPTDGSYRVRRGGSWYDYGQFCRAANRNRDLPNYRCGTLGVRVVLEGLS